MPKANLRVYDGEMVDWVNEGSMLLVSRYALIACVIALAAGLSGCSTPSSGPAGFAISGTAVSTVAPPEAEQRRQFVLVDAATRVAARIPDIEPNSLHRSFGDTARRKGPSDITVGIGDSIQITIFESAKGGLFIPDDAGSRPGNFVTLPPQLVDRNGAVKVPYAGQVQVAGRYVREIQADIEKRLMQKAIEPQAVVSVVSQRASEVAVLGDVGAANKFPVNLGGDRVLDVISRAGGIKSPGFETFVTVQRGSKSATVYFQKLIQVPQENIFVRPGDTVMVNREQRAFSVFGASGQNGRFAFDREVISLSEAMGKAGGLIDSRANPSHVYLYRIEPRSILERLGADLSAFPPHQTQIGTIYQVDLREPAGFFSSQQFRVNNNDVIYIGNADSVEIIKVFDTINAIVGPIASGASASYNLRRSSGSIQ